MDVGCDATEGKKLRPLALAQRSPSSAYRHLLPPQEPAGGEGSRDVALRDFTTDDLFETLLPAGGVGGLAGRRACPEERIATKGADRRMRGMLIADSMKAQPGENPQLRQTGNNGSARGDPVPPRRGFRYIAQRYEAIRDCVRPPPRPLRLQDRNERDNRARCVTTG